MEDQDKYIEALITLHKGLKRQGPGDPVLSEHILNQLPELTENAIIADIGCGAGAGALMLAKKYHARVKAVDFSKDFLNQMMVYAKKQGVDRYIDPIQADMGKLNWEAGLIDLLWSEGAAYNIGFDVALKNWRTFLKLHGIAVISEMNFFTENVPDKAREYMKSMYPGIKTESENIDLISSSGYQLIAAHHIPAQAWWESYYDPLCVNINKYKGTSDETMQTVIKDTEEEMRFFREYLDYYGYSFFVMEAV